MPAFRTFEIEAIRLMAIAALPEHVLKAALESEEVASYRYTGCGYFLTVKSQALPKERQSLSNPPVVGISDNIQAGFIVYLGDNELMLECHTWGEVDVPPDFRDRNVLIQTPPINYIDLREKD